MPTNTRAQTYRSVVYGRTRARAHTQYQYMHFTATTEEVFFRVPNTTAFGPRRRVDIPGRSRDEIARICVNYQHNLVIWEITPTKRL